MPSPSERTFSWTGAEVWRMKGRAADMSAELPREKPYDRLDRVLVDEASLRRRIREMGARIAADFEGLPLTVVTILQGGAVFMADLIREIHLPLKLESISVASYHGGTASTGRITFHQSRLPDIDGRHVLLLDDILDSGRTIDAILSRFREECRPLSLRTCVLLSKKVARAVPLEADYVGFEIGNEFVVGYGLDFDGEYRNLPVIGVLKPEWIAAACPALPCPARRAVMTVRVLYFSLLQDLAGTAEAEETLPPDRVWTVGDLLDRLESRTPALRAWEGRRLLAVNQTWADRDRLLRDGDEIAIMPPVQGG